MTLLKVAIIGASGIGKNHARWFAHHGCEVSAFLGSSAASVERTREVLQAGFGFAGRGYHDLEAMLGAEELDAVCIASPPALHYEQALRCLRRGLHVLCEKPLVYDAALSPDEVERQARHLVEEARARGVLLGTQMQYAAVTDQLLDAAGLPPNLPVTHVETFAMEMETKNVRPGRAFEAIWIDLAPHPLSVLQKLAPEGRLATRDIECRIAEHETEARFRIERDGAQPIAGHIVVRYDPQANPPRRRFAFNERVVDYSGRKNASGDFVSYLANADGREIERPDFVDTLIANFVAACRGEAALQVTGDDGRQNIEWLLTIMRAGTQHDS